MTEKPAQLKVRTEATPVPQPEASWMSLEVLRSEVDRLFDGFSPSVWNMPLLRPLGRGMLEQRAFQSPPAPAMDIVEKNGTFHLAVELPGMDASDIDVKISDGMLTNCGEKKEEHESAEGNVRLSERRYGEFQRSFALPDSVDTDKVKASFAKGVLTVTLPKSAKALAAEKKIEVNAA